MRWFVDEFFVCKVDKVIFLSQVKTSLALCILFLLLNLECKALMSLTFSLDPSKLSFLMTEKKSRNSTNNFCDRIIALSNGRCRNSVFSNQVTMSKILANVKTPPLSLQNGRTGKHYFN